MTKYNYNRQFLDVTIVTALFVLSFPIAQTYPIHVYVPVLTGVFMLRHFIVSRINKRDYLKAWDEQNEMLKKSKAQWKKWNKETLTEIEGYLKETDKQLENLQSYWLRLVKGLNQSGLLNKVIDLDKPTTLEEWKEDLDNVDILIDGTHIRKVVKDE